MQQRSANRAIALQLFRNPKAAKHVGSQQQMLDAILEACSDPVLSAAEPCAHARRACRQLAYACASMGPPRACPFSLRQLPLIPGAALITRVTGSLLTLEEGYANGTG